MNYILSETEYNVHNVDKGVSSEAWSVIGAFRSIPNVISVSSTPRK